MKNNNDIICPSCKRFVGAHDRCQFCGTGIKKRISLKFLRYTSLIIAIVGLVCLQLMAMHREIPVKSIASINPAMNFGYITVIGKAARPMRFYRNSDKISSFYLYLEDETGDIKVTGFKNVAQNLNKAGVSVRKGDKVKVSGTVKVKDNSVSLLLQNVKHFEVLTDSKSELVSLEEVPAIEDDTSISFKAKIARINLPRSPKAPFTIKLEDGTGSGELKVWRSQFEVLDKPGQMVEGSVVQVRALKSSYRGQPQLQLEKPGDLIILAQASATDVDQPFSQKKEVKLRDISSQNIGEKISIKAKIIELRKPPQGTKAPYILTIKEDGVIHKMIFWNKVFYGFQNANELKPGAIIAANVTVDEYRGRLQLKLYNASDLKILKESDDENSSQKVEISPADAIKLSDGVAVKIRGIVAYLKKPSEGSKAPFRIMLEGDGELIQLTCWPKTFLKIPKSKHPNKGAIIKASVTVQSYKGKKQLKLSRATDYFLEKKGAGGLGNSENNFGIIPLPDIKSINNVVDGKTVRIDGKVKNIIESDVENIPFRIILEDETGILTIVVWPNVWETFSDSQKPKIGESVSINGVASTYKETKQLRVKFAKDIKIR